MLYADYNVHTLPACVRYTIHMLRVSVNHELRDLRLPSVVGLAVVGLAVVALDKWSG